ncbi:MAG: DEAD/DEAH box helicase [Variibacter sp.]
MRQHVDAIASRLSLRPPQRRSLEILARVTDSIPLEKGGDLTTALAAIQSDFPTVTDFERDFPSLTFALATGVGKTRLMGAFVAYLHVAHGINNFFVLAPNLTIYRKLIDDFTPNAPKYVLPGIPEFATTPPTITTGENYERQIARGGQFFPTTINIFNISKINAEVQGGRSPRIRSFREEIGESYFDYLANLDDLVLLMDESHHYRATAGLRAINELKPVLGLELTATPFMEGARGAHVPFKNVVFEYTLGRAIADGYVKEPAVVTRENFVPTDHGPAAIEQIKLEDGVRLHESVKVDLETYARQTNQHIIKPFMLVIARDTSHAADLMALIRSPAFFDGRYTEKVIQIDSSTVNNEEETVARLLKIEHGDEPTEIVIHVNMLKEGWDVTNLYTIVPLRPADARTLVVQSVGRGLRLPYGWRTGVKAIDRLNIVAHDRFQEIVDEARRSDFPLRMQPMVLSDEALDHRMETIVSVPRYLQELGLADTTSSEDDFREVGERDQAAYGADDLPAVKLAYDAIQRLESQPERLPDLSLLTRPDVQDALRREVEGVFISKTDADATTVVAPDIAGLIATTATIVARGSISIPQILVRPKDEVRSGFRPFTLDLSSLRYPPPSDVLWATYLQNGEFERIGVGGGAIETQRLEDYVVSGLVAFDDVAYEQHTELLYDLAGQVTRHLSAYLSDDDVRRVLRMHQHAIVEFVHAQMQAHFWQDSDVEYDVRVTRGFTLLRGSAHTKRKDEPIFDLRLPPPDLNNIARFVFGGYEHCLFETQKFASDAERKLAIILEREGVKWFKPARGQLQIYYRAVRGDQEYQPDFVAETESRILMLEPKAANQMRDTEVLAKKKAAETWCEHASAHTARHGGKPWHYVLIPHTRIVENTTLAGLIEAVTAMPESAAAAPETGPQP